jgi:hypothetical protein
MHTGAPTRGTKEGTNLSGGVQAPGLVGLVVGGQEAQRADGGLVVLQHERQVRQLAHLALHAGWTVLQRLALSRPRRF